MSVSYVTVQWNRRKVVYDVILVAFLAAYIALFTSKADASSSTRRRCRPERRSSLR